MPRGLTETLICSVFTLVILNVFGWTYVIWMTLASPLMLLQSNKSRAQAKISIESYIDAREARARSNNNSEEEDIYKWMRFGSVMSTISPIATVSLLSVSTFHRIYSVLVNFRSGLLHLPANWNDAIFKTRLFDEPRLYPNSQPVIYLTAKCHGSRDDFEYSLPMAFVQLLLTSVVGGLTAIFMALIVGVDYLGSVNSLWALIVLGHPFVTRNLYYSIGAFIQITMLFAAIWWRFSAKSSLLFWFPLLKLTYGFRIARSSYSSLASYILDSISEKFWRIISIAIVFTFLIRAIALPTFVNTVGGQVATLLDQTLPEVQLWHLASFVNSVIAIVVFVFLHEARRTLGAK